MKSPRSGRAAAAVLAVCLLLPVGVRGQISQGTEAARKELERGVAALAQKQPGEAQAAFRRAVELDPLFYDAHRRFFNGVVYADGPDKREEGYAKARVVYREWATSQPRNAVVQYFLGQTFITDGDKADEYCLRAVKLAPNFAPAFETLARNADLRGESRKVSEYRKKVCAIKPDDRQARLSYAYSLRVWNPGEWKREMLSIAARFAHTESAADALQSLGEQAPSVHEAITYYEQCLAAFDRSDDRSVDVPTKLFVAYAKTDPTKALDFAKRMVQRNVPSFTSWKDVVAMQDGIVRARALLDEARASEAFDLLEATKRSGDVPDVPLQLMRVEAENKVHRESAAYDRLVDLVAAKPLRPLYDALVAQARLVNKSAATMEADLRSRREARTKPAPDFQLTDYRSGTKVQLANLRGKVVLVNFWFPS